MFVISFVCCVQLYVTVGFEVTVGTAQLAVVDKDQRVTTKSIKYELLSVFLLLESFLLDLFFCCYELILCT